MFDINTHVLVVDDVNVMRTTVIKCAKELGLVRFTEAEDGQKAFEILEILKDHDPIDVIISDITMPRMNGIDFLKKVKLDPRFRHIPVLMVTAEADKHLIFEAIKWGVTNYVVKPFSAATLKQKLEVIMKPGAKAA